jgi:spoIIIJ-associated protein
MAALQYLVNLMVTRRLKGKVLVGVDVERYKRRREESLRGLALRLAERVKQTGRTMTLEPMPAAERRIVHLALTDDPQVMTSSIGYGESRKVAISLRQRPQTGGRPGP